MELIPTTPPVMPSAAVQIAQSEIERLNAMLGSRIADHRERYLAFWANPSATPDEILVALGSDARRYLDAASESAGHLARLAALAGLALGEILPPEYYVPRRAFIFGADGSITLEPAPEPAPEPIAQADPVADTATPTAETTPEPVSEPAPSTEPAPVPVSSGALSTGTATPDGTLTLGTPWPVLQPAAPGTLSL